MGSRRVGGRQRPRVNVLGQPNRNNHFYQGINLAGNAVGLDLCDHYDWVSEWQTVVGVGPAER
jgi:hypothetical protein